MENQDIADNHPQGQDLYDAAIRPQKNADMPVRHRFRTKPVDRRNQRILRNRDMRNAYQAGYLESLRQAQKFIFLSGAASIILCLVLGVLFFNRHHIMNTVADAHSHLSSYLTTKSLPVEYKFDSAFMHSTFAVTDNKTIQKSDYSFFGATASVFPPIRKTLGGNNTFKFRVRVQGSIFGVNMFGFAKKQDDYQETYLH